MTDALCADCKDAPATGVWSEQQPDGSWVGLGVCSDCGWKRFQAGWS